MIFQIDLELNTKGAQHVWVQAGQMKKITLWVDGRKQIVHNAMVMGKKDGNQ